jgi:hypothetical protein
MDSSVTQRQLEEMAMLKALTATTGVVHEAQKLQLRMWGAIAFGHTTWEADIDVGGKTVIYKLKKAKQPKQLVHYIAALDRSIHWLFGDDWGLRVKEGTKALYEGARKTNVNEERARRAKDHVGEPGRSDREG